MAKKLDKPAVRIERKMGNITIITEVKYWVVCNEDAIVEVTCEEDIKEKTNS